MKDHFSFRGFFGFLCFIRVGIYSRLLRCGYGVVQKVEMPRNVWKHLFPLFSPKSTYEKHETCGPLFALKKNHGSRTRLGYLRKRRQIYKKISVLNFPSRKCIKYNGNDTIKGMRIHIYNAIKMLRILNEN